MASSYPREVLVEDDTPLLKTINVEKVPDDDAPCQIEYQVVKKTMGHCVKLGRNVRGCVSGNYLHPFHPECTGDNPGPKLLDISYNYVSAQDNANTVVSIAPSKPHDVEANFRNEIEPQAVPDSYTTNVGDSPYVEEPFQDYGSSYAPSEEYGSDSTSDAIEQAPDKEQESSSRREFTHEKEEKELKSYLHSEEACTT
ncbi:hypothetical protein FQA39_LY12587 [Lamprigera yunnana]|nr:hypothetical protein FQA39_LY12587 [Lamprigera yunnana]